MASGFERHNSSLHGAENPIASIIVPVAPSNMSGRSSSILCIFPAMPCLP
jgi:hypothetical protein